MIKSAESKLHWNYYLALERDMEEVSRYIEFSDANFSCYSIELAHIFFAAASEVDVVAKSLCKLLEPASPRDNIDHYRSLIPVRLPAFASENIYVPRYALTLDPWEGWRGNKNPIWWRDYNRVKHQRNEHFQKANLKNALNALAALLVVTFYYYRQCMIENDVETPIEKDVTQGLEPQSTLLRLDDAYYYSHLII